MRFRWYRQRESKIQNKKGERKPYKEMRKKKRLRWYRGWERKWGLDKSEDQRSLDESEDVENSGVLLRSLTSAAGRYHWVLLMRQLWNRWYTVIPLWVCDLIRSTTESSWQQIFAFSVCSLPSGTPRQLIAIYRCGQRKEAFDWTANKTTFDYKTKWDNRYSFKPNTFVCIAAWMVAMETTQLGGD